MHQYPLVSFQSMLSLSIFFLVCSYLLEFYIVNIRKKSFEIFSSIGRWNNFLFGIASGIFFIVFLFFHRWFSEELVYVFYLSKCYEFLDIVLVLLTHDQRGAVGAHFRFHHITTLSVVWMSFYAPQAQHHSGVLTEIHLAPILSNTFHHFFLYLYFSGWYPKFRTILPYSALLQLSIGVFSALASIYEKRTNTENISIAPEMYILCMYMIYTGCQIRDMRAMKEDSKNV